MDLPEAGAWLESPGREKIPLQGNCSIGRSPSNRVALESPKVSRRHAIINVQNIGEFWLIDLGSVNGTFLNTRRVHHPVRLTDFDEVAVGDANYVFRQPLKISEEYQATIAEQTVREFATIPCWLLVADVEDFTPLSQSLGSDQLATLMGGWVSNCKEVIEQQEGVINKYLGDGFLAYWKDGEGVPGKVTAAVTGLKELQGRKKPAFRIALHFGPVVIGGMESMGEESLMGPQVNFVFRMEKLAGSLGLPVITSSAVKAQLASPLECEPAGAHEVKGFEGRHEFFTG
ncbi:MAG TPA: adenylate/guanylate cyclase domain-containing protein [Chthoniobacterales bacterium]|nr:adenylate/guanylate cyclase domain-containing protein [Chthoniobacterales bacterium]